MTGITEPTIHIIASTTYHHTPDDAAPWTPGDGSDSAALIELAGRNCYKSWTRPNPATATPDTYIQHILQVGHGSVLEHASASLYIAGISRACSHELIRHRHLSYSQASQRYIDAETADHVIPPTLLDLDLDLEYLLDETMEDSDYAYRSIADSIENALDTQGVTGTQARKTAREAARAVMPNMTETQIVVTGNMRAWRHFIITRGSEYADAEIRRLAIGILKAVRTVCPEAFQDITLRHARTNDGRLITSITHEHGAP